MARRVVGIAGILVMLVAAVIVVPQRGRAEDTEPVLVVNGPKRPVPVTGIIGVNGPIDVNVTNTPKVNVNSLPAVQLAPGTVVGATNADALQPVQLSGGFKIPDGATGANTSALTVPAGKRFVLEDFSGSADAPTGQKAIFAAASILGVTNCDAPLTFVGPESPTRDLFAWGRLARFYANPGDVVSVLVDRNDTKGEADVLFTISGYFVNL